MSDVIKLVQNSPVIGPEITAELVKWLRVQADEIEKGSTAHKAVLVLYEDKGKQWQVATSYFNAPLLERMGLLSSALHGTDEAGRS